MTLEEIRELIRLVTETGVAELEVQRGDNRVRIRLSSPVEHQIAPATVYATPPPQPAEGHATPGKGNAAPAQDPNVVLVKSPIVGTFYESSAPGVAPFVRVGERVQPGKVLCIIESMKLMNEIEAEVAGVIESKLVPNGQPVEYGEALFAIRAV
jgi:acetyl-CoA carboxylase biotin carboxyl carrier protein